MEFFLRLTRVQLLLLAAAMILVIALVDWYVELNVSFGFLYLFPMLIVGNCLPRWQLAILGAGCTILAEQFAPYPWEMGSGVPRDIFMCASYCGAGLFAFESARNRRLTEQHLQEVERESMLRRDAEQQLHALIESSPAAILTVDAAGKIIMANQAAHNLLGFEPETLQGAAIHEFLPPLGRVPPADDSTPNFRTALRCSGRDRNGEVFMADVWFATYRTSAGPRLAAMLVDSSEALRDKEESSFQHLINASRMTIGAVSHEIRNVCSAISVVYENLARRHEVPESEDFRALGALVEALGKIATLELRQSAGDESLASVDLNSVLDELRIVTAPSLADSGVITSWEVAPLLPNALAERHSLLQVLLNLTKNSERAMENQARKELRITASAENGRVFVRIRDTGHGVPNPDRLFKPFQEGADSTGMGLYLSRSMVRAFHGELRHEPAESGCCFAVVLTVSGELSAAEGRSN